MSNQNATNHIRTTQSSAMAVLAAVVAAGLAVSAGCETRVVSAKGIGARESHPSTYEASPRDNLSNKIWDEK